MLTILQGDAIEQLRTLPDESVHCCVTSPPYWGLRDYGENGQIGLEKTPEEYVAKMVEVFREVRRVLRKDGTLWLNLGDSYASNPSKGGNGPNGKNTAEMGYGRAMRRGSGRADGIVTNESPRNRDGAPVPPGLKPKDLCGIPWRVAFALQADGWWLRSDIIWSKPNPMPESVTDRPTKAHEYIFLLTKSANYFYDSEAIKEKTEYIQGARPFGGAGNGKQNLDRSDYLYQGDSGNRNKRSVWTVATAPYPEAHFATYPPDLIKPCILAGTSAKGCCDKCGSPWERIVETPKIPDELRNRGDETKMSFHSRQLGGGQAIQDWRESNQSKTIGWQPTCNCMLTARGMAAFDPTPKPCTILDPFAGSGTTGAVALELGRRAILIELNPNYVELIRQRCNVTPGLQLS